MRVAAEAGRSRRHPPGLGAAGPLKEEAAVLGENRCGEEDEHLSRVCNMPDMNVFRWKFGLGGLEALT